MMVLRHSGCNPMMRGFATHARPAGRGFVVLPPTTLPPPPVVPIAVAAALPAPRFPARMGVRRPRPVTAPPDPVIAPRPGARNPDHADGRCDADHLDARARWLLIHRDVADFGRDWGDVGCRVRLVGIGDETAAEPEAECDQGARDRDAARARWKAGQKRKRCIHNKNLSSSDDSSLCHDPGRG